MTGNVYTMHDRRLGSNHQTRGLVHKVDEVADPTPHGRVYQFGGGHD